MNWTELRACLRSARWLLLLGGVAGCSGPAPYTPGEAAEKAAVTRALGDQWASLAAVLPDEAAAVRDRLYAPPDERAPRAGADVDLDAARIGLRRCESLWSKAQAAFAAGNMNEAVGTAITVKAQLDGLATTWHVATAVRGS